MIRVIKADGTAEFEALSAMEARSGDELKEIEKTVLKIIENIKSVGDVALRAYNEKFDGAQAEPLEIPRESLKKAYDEAAPDFKTALEKAAANIRDYHKHQALQGYEICGQNGEVLGQSVRGLDKVGIYVPGGTAAYPSTVLMNAIPAKIAGVGEIIMVTPPLREILANGDVSCKANPDILAAAHIAGVDRVFLSGGAQTVAALAYGTNEIPRVDKIVGPGNAYVAAAKKLLFGRVDIDMIAGPSEILVIADDTARPDFVAADMLSQAEHDAMSASILLTNSERVAAETVAELAWQLEDLPRSDIAKASLKNHGLIITCTDEDEMAALANRIAPEHLEIMTENPMNLLPKIKNAGSVFCGLWTPEALGDYLAGPNHVLPTSGAARFASPLGVYSFVKRMSYTCYTEEALRGAKDDIMLFGKKEGLDAHANAARIRFKNYGRTENDIRQDG